MTIDIRGAGILEGNDYQSGYMVHWFVAVIIDSYTRFLMDIHSTVVEMKYPEPVPDLTENREDYGVTSKEAVNVSADNMA